MLIFIPAIILSCLSFQLAAEDLEQQLLLAYKKEFAFLNAQKKNLQQRQQQLSVQYQESLQKAEKNLQSLQDKLLHLASTNEQQSQELALREQNQDQEMDVTNSLENMILQAVLTLQNDHTIAFTDKMPLLDKLRTIFTVATQVLPTLGTLRKQQMEFFLADGTKMNGEALWLGKVAAFSINPPHQGPLYPIGEGRFQLLGDFDQKAVREFLTAKSKSLVQLYLFEPGKDLAKVTTKKNLGQWITSGGPIAWVIVVLGLIALILVCWRGMILRAMSHGRQDLLEQVQGALAEKNFLRAKDFCQQAPGPRSRILLLTLDNLHLTPTRLNDLWTESLLQESKSIDRFASIITVIAAIGPLLGLLGTVTGMIATFDVITEFGTGDPKLLSGGISEALITTELGLIVAIPTLLLGNMLSSYGVKIKKELEYLALALFNYALTLTEETPQLRAPGQRPTTRENACLI